MGDDGKETTRTETVTETILEITITHKTLEEMAHQYRFNARQNEYLALMSEPENQNLWAELLGGFVGGGGEIIDPDTDWEGTGIFQWPLPQSYPITSRFGYSEDPFTGKSPIIAEPTSALRAVRPFLPQRMVPSPLPTPLTRGAAAMDTTSNSITTIPLTPCTPIVLPSA